jgi:hypothetical protein
MRITYFVNMRISGVIYPPSEKFPGFVSIIPNTSELKISDIFTLRSYLTAIKVNGSPISYKERGIGIEFKFLGKIGRDYYYIPYEKAFHFSQSYHTITKAFNFVHANQTLYYIPKTISAMFNYTRLRPSIENYVILWYIVDVRDIRGIIFDIWSHILLADKNGYEIVNEFNTFNQLWNLKKLILI